jgi:hypothetical protein
MTPRSSSLLLAGCAVVLASCTGPDIVYYAPPPDLTPDKAVSLIGTKDPKSFLERPEYRLVWAVDGNRVEDSAYRWDEPLLITAGETHRLSLAYAWGAVIGGLEVPFTGEPGTLVQIKGESVRPDTEARLWFEDAATGQILGDKQTVHLGYVGDPTYTNPIYQVAGPSDDEIAIRTLKGKVFKGTR